MNASSHKPTVRTLRPVLLAALALGVSQFALGQTPAVVFSSTAGLFGIGATPTANDYSSTAAHLAANSRGDLFVNVQQSSNGNTTGTYVLEVPAHGTGSSNVSLITGMGNPYGGHSIYVDANNNVWVADTADAQVLYIPFVNGGYPASVAYSSLTNCAAFPVPASQTATCVVPLNYPSSLGYYVQTGDLGFDGAGNLYLLDKYTGGGNYPNNDVLLQVSAATGNFTVLNSTLGNDASAEIAVDKAGDVLLTDYGSATFFTAGSYASGVGINSLNSPNGASIDSGGNFYITDTGNTRILEIPNAGGTYTPNSYYIVANQAGSSQTNGPSQGVGIDGFGTLYFAGNYPNSLSYMTVGTLTFGSTPVGTTSGSVTLNMVFNAAVTFGSFSVASPAGNFTVASTTCTAAQAYAVAGNCTVTLTYSSSAPGAQIGQLQAFDNSGNLLGVATLAGTGAGTQLSIDPGTVGSAGSGYTAPAALATDNAGNVFIADSSTGSIYKTQIGSTPKTTVASGFSSPSSIAVDGAGDLYIGDAGNSQVVEVPINATTGVYGTKIVLATGLKGNSGLALDALGDLYVADSGNARVLRLARSGGQQLGTVVSTFGSGFITPVAVAVDNANGYVYIADAGAGKVIQVGIASSVQANALTGLTTPASVAVDAAGSLFAVDSGKATITRLPYINGALSSSGQTTLPAIVPNPVALALSTSGSLYVSDMTDQLVSASTRSAAAVNFGTVAASSTSSTVTVQLSDSGNASLTFANPYFTQSGATADFAVQSSSTCANGGVLTTGQSCMVASDFSPLAGGSFTDTLTFASSTASSIGTLTLSGTSIASQTITFPQPASPAMGGTTATLTATASSGLAVTFSITSGPATLSGTNNSTISYTGPGTVVIAANQAGNASYAAASTVSQTVTVNAATLATLTAAGLTTPAYNGVAQSLTVTARDQNGNAINGFTGTVTLTSTDALATLPAAYTYQASENGIHTFSVTFGTAGPQSVTATSGSIAGSQTGIVVGDVTLVLGSSGSVKRLSGNGSALTTSGGYSGNTGTVGAVVDASGNLFSLAPGANKLVEFSATGTALSGSGYTGGGLNGPAALAIGGSGRIWIGNANGTLSVFSNTGTAISPSTGYPLATSGAAGGVAIDISGNVWVSNTTTNTIVEVLGVAAPVAPASTALTNGTTAGRP